MRQRIHFFEDKAIKNKFHIFNAADYSFAFFDLIECIQKCEIYSSERQIALSFGNLNPFVYKICSCFINTKCRMMPMCQRFYEPRTYKPRTYRIGKCSGFVNSSVNFWWICNILVSKINFRSQERVYLRGAHSYYRYF